MVIPITIREYLEQYRHGLLIDVRSPAEYEAAHIPGARSLPLFSNEERKVVGTTYKQVSREQAIKAGLDFWGSKMRPTVERAETWVKELQKSQPGAEPIPVVVQCWRGGMRSAAVAWLLDLYGFRVFTIKGGYKSYRRWCLEVFDDTYPFRVLGGHTGSGKTKILHELARLGEPVLDLEAIASHKGSAFGAINMPPQPAQEMFENKLALALYELKNSNGVAENKTVWVEDESQRIGDVNIPFEFYKKMREAPVTFLEIPFEERLNYLVNDYGRGDLERLVNGTIRIQKRLGHLEARKAVDALMNEDLKGAFAILLRYYDKWYDKAADRYRPEGKMQFTYWKFNEIKVKEIAAKLMDTPK